MGVDDEANVCPGSRPFCMNSIPTVKHCVLVILHPTSDVAGSGPALDTYNKRRGFIPFLLSYLVSET